MITSFPSNVLRPSKLSPAGTPTVCSGWVGTGSDIVGDGWWVVTKLVNRKRGAAANPNTKALPDSSTFSSPADSTSSHLNPSEHKGGWIPLKLDQHRIRSDLFQSHKQTK